MNEKTGEHFEEEPKQEQAQETELQPEAEMPEDFVEPKGKSGKWGEVVKNKELGVRYREKVIELPKHRQEETGIKRIRRREILEIPEQMICRDEKGKIIGFKCGKKENIEIAHFITNSRFPSDEMWVHTMNWMGSDKKEERKKAIDKHKIEGIYFQEFYPQPGTDYVLYKQEDCSLTSATKSGDYDWKLEPEQQRKEMISFSYLYFADAADDGSYIGAKPDMSVYVFGNRNYAFVKYIETILSDPLAQKIMSANAFLKKQIPRMEDFLKGEKKLYGELALPIVRAPGIPKFRWCYAELALIPTKRSLNVLFFETGDEDKKEVNEK